MNASRPAPQDPPHPPSPAGLLAAATAARASMVERLVADGVLTDPRLREALLRVRREVLLPHAYVRVSGPGADPIDWRLLDGSHPDDRAEWLDLVHSGESVLLQRDGEPLTGLGRGPVTGGHMTSMSTYTPATVEVLQQLRLQPEQRFLDLGTGPGITLALAAAVIGPGRATGVERDPHMGEFARHHLDRLGLGAEVVEDDALDGHPAGAPYDRIHSGIGVPCLPRAWAEQLAPGGVLLTILTTRTPSWHGQLSVTRTPQGRLRTLLRGRPRGYRPQLGFQWLTAVDHRDRVRADPGRPRPTRLPPPADDAHGFWVAAAHLAPGLVRDFQAETMTIVAPEEDSWAVAGAGDGTVRVHGPRDVWAELEDLHDRWHQAGRPDTYRVELPDGDGPQHVTSGTGPKALTWTLPRCPALPRPSSSPAGRGSLDSLQEGTS
ncbi:MULTISPECIES: methyltransferase domain-containing protein [unclassified Streptomyces]|uniref:methyltransferase domain-containing protein n=1 Tax=unclassified Streptomyces TaxID=2593676 RepID=UPI00214C6D74|nr:MULTISPECIES: methyltransferase domain-containing protein [unclassified Streptomyces]